MIQRRAAAKKWEETVKARAMKKAEHELKTRAEERRRRIARRRLITLALGALAVVMLLASVIMTITAKPAAEAAEAEILRDAKTDCAAGEENQLGDAVIFGNDGGDAVAVHGKKLLLKRCAFCGSAASSESSSQQVTS